MIRSPNGPSARPYINPRLGPGRSFFWGTFKYPLLTPGVDLTLARMGSWGALRALFYRRDSWLAGGAGGAVETPAHVCPPVPGFWTPRRSSVWSPSRRRRQLSNGAFHDAGRERFAGSSSLFSPSPRRPRNCVERPPRAAPPGEFQMLTHAYYRMGFMQMNAVLAFLFVILSGAPAWAYYHGSPISCANGLTYPDGCNSMGNDTGASVTSNSNILTVSSSVRELIDIGMCVYDGPSCSSGGPNLPPYTYIYGRGTGTGGQGTYLMTVNAKGSSSPTETVTARAVAPVPTGPSFQCGGINGIKSVGTLTPGSGGPEGPTTYKFVPLSGGTGYAAMANITVSGGGVTRVVITGSGAEFTAGDTVTNVSVANNLGGVSGFSFKVGAVGRNYACTLQFLNFFSANCYTTAVLTGNYDGCAAESNRPTYNSTEAYDLSKIYYNPAGVLYPVGVDYSTLPSFDITLQRLSPVNNASQPNVPSGCAWNNNYYGLYCIMPAGIPFVINGFDFQGGASLYLEASAHVPCVVMNSSFYPGQSALGQSAVVHADGCSSLVAINNVIDGVKLTNNSLSEIFLASNTTSEVFEYNAIMHLSSRFDEEGTYNTHLWAFNYADGLIYYGPNQNNKYLQNVHGEYYFGWYTYVSHVYNVIAGPQDANQSNTAYLFPFNVTGGHSWSWFGCAVSKNPKTIYVGHLNSGTINAPGGNGQPPIGDGDIHVITAYNWAWPTWITNGVANGGPGGETPAGGIGLYNVIASVNPEHDQPCAMTTPTGGTIDQPGWIGTFSGISGSGAGGTTYNNVSLI